MRIVMKSEQQFLDETEQAITDLEASADRLHDERMAELDRMAWELFKPVLMFSIGCFAVAGLLEVIRRIIW